MKPEELMREAIGQALRAKGQTGGNPIVGAVIAVDGKIVARGHHQFFGGPHAEVEALRAFAGKTSTNAVLYVTLEPCCTVGKTGKCTDAIIASGIKNVVVGAIDPNPHHRGEGISILRQNGVEVITGVLAKECEDLNPEFNRRMAASTAYNVKSTSQQLNAVPCTHYDLPKLFDTHCHIYYDDFDGDREEMFARAKAAGVNKMLCVGVNLHISKTCLGYAEKYPQVYASAGVHPTEAHKATDADLKAIETLLGHPKMVAIGEVGLDFYHKEAPQQDQERIFRSFLEMQQRVKKPLIIHSRDCFDRLLELLRDFGKAPYAGVFHCFTGDRKMMRQCLDLGFYISFSGILTYKKNDELRAACAECPDNRILIETDCPYLPPQSMRGKRNEPALMVETAEMAAQVRGISVQALGELTTRNALNLFGIKD